MKKKLPFVKWFIKKNNIEFQGSPRWVLSGHNKNDAEFLSGNKEALKILQQILPKPIDF